MDNNPDIESKPQSPVSETPPIKIKHAHKFIFGYIALIVLVAIASGVYSWQHKKVTNLNSQISSLQKQVVYANQKIREQSKPSTFTYAPKTGGLSLVLPSTYGVIVNVDGNDGGAPGAIFRVATISTNNVFSDSSYAGVQVSITNTFTNLNNAVSSTEIQMTTNGDNNFETTSTTVAGLPAKLITARGADEYVGNLAVYVVGSGSFLYTITNNGTQQNTTSPILAAVLKGVSIKPVTL